MVLQLGVTGGIPSEQLVPIQHYKLLQDRCGEYAGKIEQLNLSGQKYRERCRILNEKRKSDKKAIKSWQNYHDRLLAKKRNADKDLLGLLSAIDTPPVEQEDAEYEAKRSPTATPKVKIPSSSSSPSSKRYSGVGSIKQSPSAGDTLANRPSTRSQLRNACQSSPQGAQAPAIDHEGEQLQLRNSVESNPASQTPADVAAAHIPPNAPSKDLSNSKKRYQAPFIRSSQSTDEEVEIDADEPQQNACLARRSDDEPEVILARSASGKRKRVVSQPRSRIASNEVIYVKDEVGSSPLHQSMVARLSNQESLDLDEVAPDFATPRKKRRIDFRRSLQPAPQAEAVVPSLETERTRSMPPDLDRFRTESLHESILNVEQIDWAPRVSRDEHDRDKTLLDAQEYNHDHQSNEANGTAVGDIPRDNIHTGPGPLRRLDANKPLNPRAHGTNTKSNKRRKAHKTLVDEFTEDGEQYFRSATGSVVESKNSLSASIAKTTSGQRLNTLLKTSSSPAKQHPMSARKSGSHHEEVLKPAEKTAITPQNDQQAAGGLGPRRQDLNRQEVLATSNRERNDRVRNTEPVQGRLSTAKRRLENLDNIGRTMSPEQARYTKSNASTTPIAPTQRPKASTTTRNPHPPAQPGKLKAPSRKAFLSPKPAATTPLRTKPPSELKSSDFRVNPAFNDGLDHAYTDVVRGHEARKCLPGCTDPTCCGGHFRKMIDIGGAKPSPRGMWEPGSSQEDPDDALLREWMGHNAGVINSLTAKNRAEKLAQAKTAQLAGRVGRHRIQWERARSPPGFWRADFPSTQEVRGDVAEAAKREREVVEGRKREALRGGRWKFADE